MNVANLRQNGYNVRVLHTRRAQYIEKTKEGFEVKTSMFPMKIIRNGRASGTHTLLAKGGKTEVRITDPKGRVFESETLCSKKENYSYKRGLDVCLGRIEKAMKEISD